MLKMTANGQHVALEYTVATRCVAVVLKPAKDQMGESENKHRTEREIFQDFVDENRTCYWNPHLKESIENVRFAGYLLESLSLLLAGRDIYLNTVLDAWSRRVLRPPQGFLIHTAGEISRLAIQTPSQCLFTPLPEVVCLIISDCNDVRVCATFDVIVAQLQQHYSTVQQPDETFVYATLENLMKERKIYHSGSGYFIVTPDTLQLNNCITVVDNHVIIGSTGSHDNGIPAIYLPLLAGGNMVASEKKSISCQTETKANDKRSVEVEKSKIPAKGEHKSLFKRMLCRNKKLPDVKTVKEDTTTMTMITTPVEATPCTSRPKSRESDPLQTAHENREEPVKVRRKSAEKSNHHTRESNVLRHSCLDFTTRKKSLDEDDAEIDRGLIPTRHSRTQRSRSMSPDPRSSALDLTLDEMLSVTENYKALRSRTLEDRRRIIPTEKLPSLTHRQRAKSTESLQDFSDRDQRRTGNVFELELSRPHEVIVKTKRTVLGHFPDSHKYISRVYRKYHKMKSSSAGKVSRHISHRSSLLHRSGQRSLSQDSGLNYIGEGAQRDSPVIGFCQRMKNDRPSDHQIAKTETAADNTEQLIRKSEVRTPTAEDSGFLSFQLGSTITPFYLSLEPTQNSIQQKTLANDNFLEANGQELPSEKATSERYSKYRTPHSGYASFCTSVPLTSSGHGDGDGLVHTGNSCQTGSSWSNSSRLTVVEMPCEKQIARLNLDDAAGTDRSGVDEPCYLVTPSVNLKTSLQVDEPTTLSESSISSFARKTCSQNKTDHSAILRSPNEATFVDFERQRSGRNRLRGVSSGNEICK